MKAILVIILAFFALPTCSAQIDFLGMAAREVEEQEVKKLKNEVYSTTQKYLLTTPVVGIELMSRTKLDMAGYASINFFDYKNVCTYYVNPITKRSCQNKINYLKEAYKVTSDLLYVGSRGNTVNRGIKEQIGEKHAHITNAILKELDAMKHKSDKELYWRKLVFGVK